MGGQRNRLQRHGALRGLWRRAGSAVVATALVRPVQDDLPRCHQRAAVDVPGGAPRHRELERAPRVRFAVRVGQPLHGAGAASQLIGVGTMSLRRLLILTVLAVSPILGTLAVPSETEAWRVGGDGPAGAFNVPDI